MIKAIIFDFHDTVIENGLNFIFREGGYTLKPKTWQPFWRGEVTEEQFWQNVAADFCKDRAWIERAKAIYYSKSIPIRTILPLVKKLKKTYKLGLLANCPKPWFDNAISRFNLDKMFNVLVSSGGTGLLKPGKEIYLLICQKLRVSPQECLYIDDEERKLEAAQKLGMKGVGFKSPKQLANELKREGILG